MREGQGRLRPVQEAWALLMFPVLFWLLRSIAGPGRSLVEPCGEVTAPRKGGTGAGRAPDDCAGVCANCFSGWEDWLGTEGRAACFIHSPGHVPVPSW